MADKKINQYPVTSSVGAADLFLIGNPNTGTLSAVVGAGLNTGVSQSLNLFEVGYSQDSASFINRIVALSGSVINVFASESNYTTTASLNTFTASIQGQLNNVFASESNYTLTSSFNSYTGSENTTRSNVFASQSNYTSTSSFQTFTGSYIIDSGSFNSKIVAVSSSFVSFSASFTASSGVNTSQVLPYSSSIIWNYSSGSIAVVTLGGVTSSLSITNIKSSSFGVLRVVQDTTGSRVLTVPGSTPSKWAFSNGASQFDVLGFFYDGQSFYWSQDNYGTTFPNLTTPILTIGTITATSISSSWSSVVSASAYILQRATDAGFSSITTLYTGLSQSFNDTGLSPSTQYFYRVKATAVGFNDSSYGTANGTTNAFVESFISWKEFANTVDGGSGSLNGINSSTPAGGTAIQQMQLNNNNYVQFTFSSSLDAADACILALSNTDDANYANGSTTNHIIVGMAGFGGNFFVYQHDTNTFSNVGTALTNQTWRIKKSGNDALVQSSTDAITFNTVTTATNVFATASNAYIKAIFGENTATQQLQHVKGFGLI